MTSPIVDIQGVSRSYGAVRAVDDVSLAVNEGELFGLIGHNGAGKSTLMRIMLGLLRPDSGSVRLFGAELDHGRLRELYTRCAYVPENVVFYDNLSGLETLRFYAELKGAPAARCAELLEEVGLAGAGKRPVRAYSKGMRQRLGLAQAMLAAPRLLLLDEPTSGLDPAGIRELYGLLAGLRGTGVCILLSSHSLAEIENRVDRLGLMRHGRIEAVGSLAALRAGLSLPVRLRAKLRPGAGATLVETLQAPPECTVSFVDGHLVVECPPERKMALLEKLTALSPLATDIDIHEPSLEDVFHEYGRGTRETGERADP